MSAGLCVLTSDTPENLEALGDSGFTFKRGDLVDLARMLTDLLSDEQLRSLAGERAQKRVRENFLWDDVVDDVAAIYRCMGGDEQKRTRVHSAPSQSLVSIAVDRVELTNHEPREGTRRASVGEQETAKQVPFAQ